MYIFNEKQKSYLKRVVTLVWVTIILVTIKGNSTIVMANNVSENDKTWVDMAASGFAGGKGTLEEPYLISNAEQLAYLAKVVNNGNTRYIYCCYELTGDIDLAGYEWIPIGACQMFGDFVMVDVFNGCFDGKGYTIKNMTITKENPNGDYGLFGVLAGLVRNVKMTNVNISLDIENHGSIGAIAGVCRSAGINDYTEPGICNCDIVGKIEVSGDKYVSAGGVVGTVEYCSIDSVMVNADINVYSEEYASVGGFAGAYLVYLGRMVLTEGCFKGSIQEKGNGEVGGLVGDVFVESFGSVAMVNCYSDANISGESTKGTVHVGGLLGYHRISCGLLTYQNLYFSGKVNRKDLRSASQLNRDYKNIADPESEGMFHIWLNQKNSKWINLVSITDSCVYAMSNENTFDSFVTKEFLCSSYNYSQIFEDELNFDNRVWNISGDKLPELNFGSEYGYCFHKDWKPYVVDFPNEPEIRDEPKTDEVEEEEEEEYDDEGDFEEPVGITYIVKKSVKVLRRSMFYGKNIDTIKIKGTKCIRVISKKTFKGYETKHMKIHVNKKMSNKEYKKLKKKLRAAGFKGKIKRVKL